MTIPSSSDEQEPPEDAVVRGSPTFPDDDDSELAAADAGTVVDVDTTMTALEERANRLELAAKHLRRTQVATLLRAAQSGDERAWTLLVNRFDRVLRSVARAYRLSPPEAEDAVRATWLTLHRHIGRLRDASRLDSWLATTMRRESLRALQRHPELRELADAASDEADETSLVDDVDQLAEDFAAAAGSHASLDEDPAQHFLIELERLVGDRSPDADTLERAARLVAAEQSWRDGLGLLLDEEDVARLLAVDRRRLAELATGDELIVLTAPDGTARYPAYQFQDGRTTPTLARAHRTLVETGHVSPWSAASWVRTSHPELEFRSPVQWVGEHRDDAALLLVADRDAARSAQ